MTEPAAPETPAARGAEPEAAEPFEPGPGGLTGCGKPAVIGCLVVLALVGVGLVVLVTQAPKLLRHLMGTMEAQVTAALPEDLEAAERQRLEEAFAAAGAALTEGRADSTSLANLQTLADSLPAEGETLSREEVAEITRLLEEIAAVDPAPSASHRRPAIPLARPT